ncbi:MAG: hypothetical protein HYY23_00525 [Verrucomicrobia bacterium]|nr:hypothetical protein [Verrucomicrobiota bacterium]
MNAKILLISLIAVNSVVAQKQPPKPVSPTPPPPPPVVTAQPAPAPPSSEKYVYEHKFSPDRPYLVSPEQAQTIINRFKDAYGKMGSPRVLIYVNRELVDEASGLKLSARSEQTETSRGHVDKRAGSSSGAAAAAGAAKESDPAGAVVAGDLKKALADSATEPGTVSGQTEKVTSKNTYRVRERKEAALADKQTVRDVERLFGRPLRMAGATLVDQRVAAHMIGDKPLASVAAPTEGEQARKDREALTKNADAVLEILISSRQITVPTASGDRTFAVPDIQATAIRLKDAKIIGQASSSDLIGQGSSKVVRNFGVREISEGTALALMEDMTQ